MIDAGSNDNVPSNAGARLALHPAVVVALVWALAAGVWYFAPSDVLAASRVDQRAGSLKGLAVFGSCVFALAAGATAGSALWSGTARRELSSANSAGRLPALLAAACLFGGAVWVARILLRVGGPGPLLDLFLGGQSIADLKSAVFTPAQLPPLTTIVHFSPPAASMLLVQRRIAGWRRLDLLLFLGLVLLAAFRTLVLAERLAALGMGTAIAVTWVFTSPTLSPKRILACGAGGLGVLWLAWSAGEFSRSWLDSEGAGSSPVSFSEFRESLDYSQDRLGAYIFTAVNNGLIVVDEAPGQSFPENFVPAAARLGLVDRSNVDVNLYDAQLNREFTGESLPGQFFRDARELAFVLALVCGVVFGVAWRLASLNSPAGLVLYASIVPVLVDSYRSAYLFDIQGLAAFAAFGMLLLGTAHRRQSHSWPALTKVESGDELLGEARPAVAL